MQHPATKLTAATTGRYQLTLCVGADSTTLDTDDLSIAERELEAFKADHADNRDAHAGIYDRYARATLLNWRGGSKRLTGEALFMATLGEPWWPAIEKRAAQMGGGL